jgi:hypothetical protein
MQLRVTAVLLGLISFCLISLGLITTTAAPAWAHHSFAMFDADNQIDIVGAVTQFKLTSPHAFIIIKVKGTDGSDTVWSLEGSSASSLVRDGLTSNSLKAGDEIKVKIAPLRSGAPGGAWAVKDTFFADGKPLASTHR